MSYWKIYEKRLNRFGTNYQERIQGQREEVFRRYLQKTIYFVSFELNGEMQRGSFERFKQDNTRTLHYLLTEVTLNIPNGTILKISNKDNIEEPWMVYYLENIKARGYNRYIMLRMTHFIEWENEDGEKFSSHAYMYGQEDNMLKDEIRSRSRMRAIYRENLKLSFFIMPVNPNIRKGDYFVVNEGTELQEAYRVTGYDMQSAEGIEYVTVDPTYLRDRTPAPTYNPEVDSEDDFFWLQGGVKE